MKKGGPLLFSTEQLKTCPPWQFESQEISLIHWLHVHLIKNSVRANSLTLDGYNKALEERQELTGRVFEN